LLAYDTHTTGVILRAYNSQAFRNEENKICVQAKAVSEGIMEIQANDKVISVMGVYQDEENKASDESKELLFEATYIHPDTLVEAVANTKLNTDTLYYKTSRGSNPDLEFGLTFLSSLMEKSCDISCYEGSLNINVDQKTSNIIVDAKEVSDIVGMDIPIAQIVQILRKLGFGINSMGNHVIAVSVPSFRHDISHIQDIAEEIVRIVGINNIPAKPFVFAEKPRLNNTTEIYKAKKGFKNRAVGACFYENISYVFADKSLLAQYHFPLVEESLDVANPIAEELNTLRSTILINLLLAVKRNVSHSRKSIALFEMGAVFGSKREQSQVLSFVFSGEIEGANISNSGKPKDIDFARFTQKIGAVVGAFELEPCTASNTLLHPYQSANVLIDGKVCGFISKLHPTAQEAFAVPETFIAELEMDAFLPKHQNATAISKFQGVYKDLSIVIDKSRSFYEVAKVLSALELEMLKESYAVDIYEDEKLGDKKSLTMRFFIQAMDKTLEEADIDNVMAKIMSALELECNASLR
jgi:phenylalanyl-tRNA synthetase beta chain